MAPSHLKHIMKLEDLLDIKDVVGNNNDIRMIETIILVKMDTVRRTKIK